MAEIGDHHDPGPEGELGLLAFTTESLFASEANAQEVLLGPAYASGRWYQSQITIDATGSQIRWLFVDELSGFVQLGAVRPASTAGVPAQLCVRAPTNDDEVPDVFGSAARLDGLRVEVTPPD